MQITNTKKQETVSKIRRSNTFKKAPTSSALLQYLHDATNRSIELKEGLIDIEFFGGKESSDKTNARVRVNVYNLRKKLTSYYEKEGKEDSLILLIDKGQYQVSFVKKQVSENIIKKLSWQQALPYLALVLLTTYIFLTNIPSEKPKIWESFLDNSQTTNLIIGDVFGAKGKTITSGSGWTRDYNINNINQFYELIDKKPELKNILRPANYSYTTDMAAIAAQKFQEMFQNHGSTFSIRFSTRTSTTEIKEGNAIYVGPIKNDNHFIHFFNKANPYFKVSNTSLTIFNHHIIKDTVFNLNDVGISEEYAIVSKYPASDDSEHFVFFSQHNFGTSATVEYFTNLDSIKNFEDNYLKENDYFTAIFKVKGQNRTNTGLTMEKVVTF